MTILELLSRGVAKERKGDSVGALGDYTDAIGIDPTCAVAYYYRGNLKVRMGDNDGAVVDCTSAIGLKADYAEAYVVRGAAKQAKGDQTAARVDQAAAEGLKRKALHDRQVQRRKSFLKSFRKLCSGVGFLIGAILSGTHKPGDANNAIVASIIGGIIGNAFGWLISTIIDSVIIFFSEIRNNK